jgi:hypothetical protein
MRSMSKCLAGNNDGLAAALLLAVLNIALLCEAIAPLLLAGGVPQSRDEPVSTMLPARAAPIADINTRHLAARFLNTATLLPRKKFPIAGDSHGALFGRGVPECQSTQRKLPRVVRAEATFVHVMVRISGTCRDRTDQLAAYFASSRTRSPLHQPLPRTMP